MWYKVLTLLFLIRAIRQESVAILSNEPRRSLSKAAFIMYATGGGRGFFFQRLVFLYPPPRSIQIFRTPQAISRKINTPPSPLPPPKKYQNKYLYNSKLYMFEISRDMFNKNIERALTVYVIPMPASLSSAN